MGRKKMKLIPLVAATYCMVAGGPFGLEEIVGKSGYAGAIIILILTPLFWSFPTALMVSELTGAIPEEGGFYIWVRRAMGKFWGFQEAWLTLVGSFFDMGIYPTLFAVYIGKIIPGLANGYWPILIGFAMIAVCIIWNLRGAEAVGEASAFITLLFLLPFVVIVGFAMFSATPNGSAVTQPRFDLLGGILIAMWNYMGWDNASTISGEVDQPQRTYPIGMAIAVLLVMATYIIPVAAMWHAGIHLDLWTDGGWVDIGKYLGGNPLALAITIGGTIAALATFNALVLSLSRLPLVMAEDGFLPKVFGRKDSKTGVPVFSVIVCSIIWASSLLLGFERLILLDILLTGLSIVLEFIALIVLRYREPFLARPFKIPGGIFGTIAISIGPIILIILTFIRNDVPDDGFLNPLWLGVGLVLLGPLVYLTASKLKKVY